MLCTVSALLTSTEIHGAGVRNIRSGIQKSLYSCDRPCPSFNDCQGQAQIWSKLEWRDFKSRQDSELKLQADMQFNFFSLW